MHEWKAKFKSEDIHYEPEPVPVVPVPAAAAAVVFALQSLPVTQPEVASIFHSSWPASVQLPINFKVLPAPISAVGTASIVTTVPVAPIAILAGVTVTEVTYLVA